MERPALPVTGELVAGKYRIEARIGAGGMATVFAARHVQLGHKVAVKVLLPELATEDDTRRRFVREVRAAGRLGGEHVARVFEGGELSSGLPYMVLEHLVGRSLADELGAEGPFAAADAIDYVLQAAEAVAEAHALGIVHRDLSASNLFVTRSPGGAPFVKVLDFGVSKDTRSRTSALLSIPGIGAEVVGSPLYIAPEQLMCPSDVDGRADVWSLGVVLFQLSTGVLPFQAGSLPKLCAMILQQPPPDPNDLAPGLPPGFRDVLLRALAKNRDERFDDLAALARALVPFGRPSARDAAQRIARILSAARTTSIERTAPAPCAPPAAQTTRRSRVQPAVQRHHVIPIMAGVVAGALVAMVALGRHGATLSPSAPGPTVVAPVALSATPMAMGGAPGTEVAALSLAGEADLARSAANSVDRESNEVGRSYRSLNRLPRSGQIRRPVRKGVGR